jgi:hypothetical protein
MGVTLAVLGGLAGAQPDEAGMTLEPMSGDAGIAVTATFPDVDTVCTSSRVQRVDTGEAIGSSAGGMGEVEFRIPDDAPPDANLDLEVTCGASTGSRTGMATFFVTGTTTTTATAPTTVDGEPTTTVDRTTTTEGTGPTSPPAAPENLAECEEQAQEAQGRLVYEPERRMVVDQSHDVRAVLSLDDLPPDVTFETPTTVVELDVRCVIRAVLRGPDFTVTPDEPREQSFVGTRQLVWDWQVRPERAGEGLRLDLVFQAMVVDEDDDREVPGPELLHRAVIDVDATPVSPWRRIVDAVSGFFGNPAVQYLLPAGGLGGLWLLFDKAKRKRSQIKPG